MTCKACFGTGRLRLIDRDGSVPCPGCAQRSPAPASYTTSLTLGCRRPVRYRRGEGVNQWGSKINELAMRLDAMDLPAEAVPVLRELFEEIGQLGKDAESL